MERLRQVRKQDFSWGDRRETKRACAVVRPHRRAPAHRGPVTLAAAGRIRRLARRHVRAFVARQESSPRWVEVCGDWRSPHDRVASRRPYGTSSLLSVQMYHCFRYPGETRSAPRARRGLHRRYRRAPARGTRWRDSSSPRMSGDGDASGHRTTWCHSPRLGHEPSSGRAWDRERRIEPRMPDQSVTDLVDDEAGLSTDAG